MILKFSPVYASIPVDYWRLSMQQN